MRKRRPGVHSARAVAHHGPPPIIPIQYTQPFFAPGIDTPSLQALQAFQCSHDRKHAFSNVLSLILDTGASISVTNCIADFVGPVRPVQHTTLQGIAAGLAIKGIGMARYHIRDDTGNSRDYTIPGVLYVPDCPSRLVCPRQLLASTGNSGATMTVSAHSVRLHLAASTIPIPYHGQSFLPILYTTPTMACYQTFCQHAATSPPAASSPDATPHGTSGASTTVLCRDPLPALSSAQRTKLLWHRRLNHASFDRITAWMRSGLLPVPKGVVNAPNPVCAACNYGKSHHRSHHISTGVIGADHLSPGAGVSADQLEAGCPGLVPTTKGSPTTQRYRYCNVWVDHFSRLVYVTMHASKDAKEMLNSKLEFEAFCKRHGVSVKSIRADNGVYSSQVFRAHCDTQFQRLSFCAVGGHWQNGVAERAIGMIQNAARTILLHAMHQWPSKLNEAFWPFAIRHAVNLYNHTPRIDQTISPWELFTGEPSTRKLADYHVFGSPVYVLHKTLQDATGSGHKWRSRCWQGIYLGHSPMHAGNVALVYNPDTSHVTPQFHVTWDDTFSSVASPNSDGDDQVIETLLDKTAWLYTDAFAPPTAHHCFGLSSNIASASHTDNLADLTLNDHPTNGPAYKPVRESQQFSEWKQAQGIAAEVFAPCVPATLNPPCRPSNPPTSGTLATTLRASPGTSVPEGASPNPAISDSWSIPFSEGGLGIAPPIASQGASPIYAFPATPPLGDTLTQSVMLKAPDQADFVQAQAPEIEGLHSSGVFSYHPIASLPPRAKLLNAIWSYRRKRTPAGALLKHKARICTDGSQQQYGIDYWETYAPVVSWTTVRLLLTLASLHGWKSTQIDFAQALTQPPIEEDIYMRVPQGWYVVNGQLKQHANPKFRDTEHYIKLEKSLYGIKQAARAWFHHLEPGLLKLGFKASEVDPCLFYRSDCIVALYVDDCLIFSPDQAVLDQVTTALKADYQIGAQGSVQDFLGINIHTSSDGITHFSQPGLINSIVQELNLQECHKKYTPAISVLHPDHGGFARCESWNYRSVLGKLNYLAQMTRPDISMAVHNCARLTTSPTYLHEQAIKRIGRYLSATCTRGLIYRPTATGNLDMFVDADFAGTWHKEFFTFETA
jgi:hypothetical protein